MMGRGQGANLARMPRLNPYSFLKDILGSPDLDSTSHLKDGLMGPSTIWLPIFFKISYFVFRRTHTGSEQLKGE